MSRPDGASRVHGLFVLLVGAALVLLVGGVVAVLVLEPRGSGSSPSGSAASSPTTTQRAAERAAARAARALPREADLLTGAQVRPWGPRQRWRVTRTDNNTAGSGLNSLCQRSRFADPRGYAALVRVFRTGAAPRRTAVQTVEVSRSPKQARRGYRTALDWYAGCRAARLQVVDAHRVRGVGDRADLLTLRIWRQPVRTLSVALARTGSVTTTTVTTTPGTTPPAPRRLVGVLARAVRSLCDRTGTSGCVHRPAARAVPPPPAGGAPGLLVVADLPPVGRIDEPWVGTRAVTPQRNPAATTCDDAAFAAAGATTRRSRTYLVPQADLPTRFGLTETSGRFRSPKAAAAFLAGVRRRVAGCERRDLASKVSGARTRRTSGSDLSQWQVTTRISKRERIRFRLGFVRIGPRVAQLTFVPAPPDDMTSEAFGTLLGRAGDRLREVR